MSEIFNVNESKELMFDLSVAGVMPQDLVGRFSIIMEEMMVSFPAKIDNSKIIVKVPALDNLIKSGLSEGTTYNAKLEIQPPEDAVIVPWTGEIVIKKPIDIKTSMVEMKEVLDEIKPTIKVNSLKIKTKKKVDESCGEKHDKKKKKDIKDEKEKSKLSEIFK